MSSASTRYYAGDDEKVQTPQSMEETLLYTMAQVKKSMLWLLTGWFS